MKHARKALLFALLLAPSAFLARYAGDMPHLGHFQDDGIYWTCAKSIASGMGYRIESLPGAPYQTKYPPLYPLLLAPIWKWNPAFPGNLRVAMLAAWLALPLFLLAARRFLDGACVPAALVWLVLGALALNPFIVFFSTTLMPELLFTALVLTAIFLAGRAEDTGCRCAALMAGLAAGLAYLTKSSAAPLLATVPLGLLLRRQARSAGIFSAGMLPAMAAWALWSRAHLEPTSDAVTIYYTDYLRFHRMDVAWSDFPALVWKNLNSLVQGAGGLIHFSVSASFATRLLLTVLGVAAIAGIVRWTRRTRQLQYPLFAAGFSLQLLLWNFPPNERLLLPLAPLLCLGFAVESSHLLRMLRASWRGGVKSNRAAAVVILALLAVLGASIAVSTGQALTGYLPGVVIEARCARRYSLPLYRWMEQNLPPRAAVLTCHDTVLYLNTGIRAARPIVMSMPQYRYDTAAMRRPFESLSTYARQHGFEYFLLTRRDYSSGELAWGDFHALLDLVRKDAGLILLHETPGCWLYKVSS